MKKKLNCILLIDDNPDDNFFHERIIKKSDAAKTIVSKQTGMEALMHLKSGVKSECMPPDLIFLDINMPGMNGWEFLEEYKKMDKKLQSRAIVVMLTTSENPDDRMKSNIMNVASDFRTKPLTQAMLQEIIDRHFQP